MWVGEGSRTTRQKRNLLHNGGKANDYRHQGAASVAKFLIEVPHKPERLACARVVHTFLSSGSHFLAQADWGCADGNHSAWMIVDVDSKDDARDIVPPALRSEARIIGLNRFSIDYIDDILSGRML
jgi:hypothetical protein